MLSLLYPILAEHPDHRASLERVAVIREAEGQPSESVAARLTLAQAAEASGEIPAAVQHYRRILAAAPGHPEATARLAAIAPAPPSPVEGEPGSTREDARSGDDVQAALQEAEVLARYGLKDRAAERLRVLTKRHPEELAPRERLLELLLELDNPAVPREASSCRGLSAQGREHGRALFRASVSRRRLRVPRRRRRRWPGRSCPEVEFASSRPSGDTGSRVREYPYSNPSGSPEAETSPPRLSAPGPSLPRRPA